MPTHLEHLYLGGRGRVVALDKRTGDEVWTTDLKVGWFRLGNSFVTLVEGVDHLYAFAYGIAYCLTKNEGLVVWQHKVKELKNSLASLSVDGAVIGPRGTLSPWQQQALLDAQSANAAAVSSGGM